MQISSTDLKPLLYLTNLLNEAWKFEP